MPTDAELEKYKKADGTIDWGELAKARLAINDNLLLKKKSKQKNSKPLEDLTVFKLADGLSDDVWKIVMKWDWFSKKTIGDQIVRSADSVGANIAEGYGRYFFGDYIVFLYYARGSLYETRFWLEKAHKRELINDDLYEKIRGDLDRLPVEINKVIKVVRGEKRKWKGRNIDH